MTNDDNICPDCGGGLVFSNSETVCSACGTVFDDVSIARDAEWRSFDLTQANDRSRVGTPLSPSVHDKGLSTVIGKGRLDAHGKTIPFKDRIKFYRMKKWQFRSKIHESVDRNLNQAMSELALLSEKLHLTKSITDEASTIYRDALGRGLVRGRSINAMIAASVYAACRIRGIPRSINEINSNSKVDKKDITRCYRLIVNELKLNAPNPSTKDRIPKIAAEIGVSQSVELYAIDIIVEAEKQRISAGKDPSGMAAAALYIACIVKGEKRSQKLISAASGVTEVTIRNRYKGLKEKLNIDVIIK
jgi:transcription initiation factor TFIIB